MQAISIYTRDLGLELETRPGAPTEITPDSLGAVLVALQSSGARAIFWCAVRRDRPEPAAVLYAIAVEHGAPAVYALPAGRPDTPDVYRALALKLRAVLTGAAAVEPREPTPPPRLPPPPLPPLPPTASPAPSTTPTPPAPVAVAPTAPRRPRLTLATRYVATLPLETVLIRHGIEVDAVLPFRSRFEAHLEVELTAPPTATVAAGSASLLDVPIRLGARGYLGGRRLRLGAGPLVGLHIIDVDGFGTDGTRGHDRRVSAGLGGDIVGRARLSDHVSIELVFRVEELVPNARFTLHGTPIFASGGVLFGVGAGLVLAAL